MRGGKCVLFYTKTLEIFEFDTISFSKTGSARLTLARDLNGIQCSSHRKEEGSKRLSIGSILNRTRSQHNLVLKCV